jgi:uncharacterized damage-inducible protein DinB
MNQPALTGEEMLAWNQKVADNWRQFLIAHPELLALPCDIMGGSTVAQLLQHIVAVEQRYAERLSGLPATDYSAISYGTVDEIYATGDRALGLFRKLLASDVDWDETIEFTTRAMGPTRSTRKTIFFHALLHSTRHYAQLATLVRQHGVQPDWPMDYLFMQAEPA